MSLTVNAEIVTKNFDQAVDLFGQTILKDARGCQGSNRLLLTSLKIEYPYGYALGLHQSVSPATPRVADNLGDEKQTLLPPMGCK